MKRKIVIWCMVLLPVGLLSLAFSNDNHFQVAKNIDIFSSMFKEVNAHYVDEIDPEAIVSTGIDAMLSSLDPYNNFITEEELDDYRTSTTGEYAGIGAVYAIINNKVRITRLHEGFSAQRSGIELGDELISVDGIKVSPKNIFEISKTLKGQINSNAIIEVRKFQGEIKKYTVSRERISVGSVTYHGLIDPKTGYIKLEEFTMGAGREVKEALIELKNNGAEQIILDIRDNGGGLLTEAVSISNVFIPKGKKVVSTLGQFAELNQEYFAMYDAADTEIPLIVLVNGESASASEVVSGVIQDYDRGVLVGRKTFGKGLVQTTRSLNYNTQLNVTTAKYYIPSGRCIQAIDYSTEDHSKFDNDKRESFKTSNGRTVFDGSGLEPDIAVESRTYSPLSISLAYSGLLFEYAIKFKSENSQKVVSREFSLSDEQYNTFKEWVRSKNVSYLTGVENELDELVKTAEEEEYIDDISEQISSLRKSIIQNKASDLDTHKKEIKALIEEQIVATYNFYRGEVEYSFSNDSDISAALEIFANPERYAKILGK